MNPTRMTLLATTLIAAPAWSQDTSVQPEVTVGITEQTAVTASDFMVASANPLATEAGAAILRAGGSAADAAVAVQMMLNLVEPQSSGIGGGAFALYWNDALGTLTTFDGRETAPAAATPDYWMRRRRRADGLLGRRARRTVGRRARHPQAHGDASIPTTAACPGPTSSSRNRPRRDRLRQSRPASPRSISGAQEQGLDAFPAARAYFFDADGLPMDEGTMLANPEFARTLRLIAAEGSAPFYTGCHRPRHRRGGPDRDQSRHPDPRGSRELRGDRARRRSAWTTAPRNVCGMGPPTSGGADRRPDARHPVGHFDLPGMGAGPEAAHLFAEAGQARLRRSRPLHGRQRISSTCRPRACSTPPISPSAPQLIDPATAMAARLRRRAALGRRRALRPRQPRRAPGTVALRDRRSRGRHGLDHHHHRDRLRLAG